MEEIITNETTWVLGRNSNNETVQYQLYEFPHLFISYNSHAELYQYWVKSLVAYPPGTFSCAVAIKEKGYRQLEKKIAPFHFSFLYISDRMSVTGFQSLRAFLKGMKKELERRLKARAKPAVQLTPLFILADDLIPFLIPRRKSDGLLFLELLLQGPAVGMHWMIGSSQAYKTLIAQLLNLHPVIRQELETRMPGFDLTVHYPLGAELVMTTDGLYFFKHRYESGYERLFAI